ncbi:MAG TPA: DUF3999 family protein [Candidatus Angelobacter sp.]|nr:DUF3999 family protein [Candidatus Angelobacter sp.]
MKTSAALLAAILLAGPSISFFKFQRPVQVPAAGQHYFTVDEAVWKNARRDLGDLRLYKGQVETPYALVIARGGLEHEHKDVRVMQQATVAGKTQFIIDMTGTVEYDHVELNLAAKNFVAHARVEGQDDLHGPHWAVAEPILYDLSKEDLGGNRMLRLPVSTYKYLRVTIDGPVKPEDVTGASSEFRQEQQAAWRDVATSPSTQVRDRDSVLTFALPQNVPVERVKFDLDPSQGNFRREVDVEDDHGFRVGSGEISQVKMVRNGNRIDTSNLEVNFSAIGDKSLKVVIHNGDDQPLQQHASLQQQERRIYFDAPAGAPLTLYYGDEKLDPPVYDYAKLFQMEANASAVRMGAEQTNAAYSGRPDERPWTERHPVVLWIAILAAVAVLGAIALRSMKTAAAS